MGKRRDGRLAAAQFLFSRDLNNEDEEGNAAALEAFWGLRTARPDVREFANSLVTGVLQHLNAIDGQLASATENFRLERLSTIDRNILRVATYELAHAPDVPSAVVINEAIEVAKQFGGDEAGHFVNGVLDRVRRGLDEDRVRRRPDEGEGESPTLSQDEGGSEPKHQP